MNIKKLYLETMYHKEEFEFQFETMNQVLNEMGLSNEQFAHAAVKCIYEITQQIPNGIYEYILAGVSDSSNLIIDIVKEILIRYYELENFRKQIKGKENGT